MSGGPEGRATVVVAAADEVVGEVLARILEADGREAIRLPDPSSLAEAVTTAAADAVVVDLDGGTADALRSLRGTDDDERLLACRAVAICTGPANALLAWHAGADAVLTRPFAADALQAALGEALAAEEPARQGRRDAAIRELGQTA